MLGIPLLFMLVQGVKAQSDTSFWKLELENVQISGFKKRFDIKPLPQIHQTYIFSGKKSESIPVAGLSVNLAEKTGRQLFAKIPGIFVYDMDGSGNQINIAARGLDPHRSWEFNVRQNGVLLNSDLYGYPASHYSMPLEAVQRIELVRGTASLQYGAEFGGMLNYVIKEADTTRRLSVESVNTIGAFGLMSLFQSVGGKINGVTYYGYYQKRYSQGYRDNSRSNAECFYAGMSFAPARQMKIDIQVGRSQYLYQIPGPLTDSMFLANPRQSTRSRNYYTPDIWVPSVQWSWKLSEQTKMHTTFSGIWGQRSSVQFEGFATQADNLLPATGQYAGRWVDIDRFHSRTAEWRLLHQYKLLGRDAALSAGIRYFNNRLQRRQRGQGSLNSDFDLSVKGEFGRDLWFLSESIAGYLEHMVKITKKWTVSAGFRYEHGQSRMTGKIVYLEPGDIPQQISHRIPAAGISSQFQFQVNTRLYGGISQAHRPVVFKDIIPGSVLETVAENVKNATGFNAELGLNGSLAGRLRYDISVFALQYYHRMGNILRNDADGNLRIVKTNIGNSLTRGIESYTEVFPIQTDLQTLSFFTSASWMKSTYQNSVLFNGKENIDISGNSVESVPRWIIRSGVDYNYQDVQFGLQYNYTAKTFSDPFNTVISNKSGSNGAVPAYTIWDVNSSIRISTACIVKAGITNVLNTSYFTKRPLFYPGPGVWSSDGRGYYLTLSIKL